MRAETQERAWTPATTFDGRKLPYGWAGSFNPMKGRGWSIASGGYRYDTEKASHELLTRRLDDRRRAVPNSLEWRWRCCLSARILSKKREAVGT